MTAIDTSSEAFRLFRDAHKDAYGFRANPCATTQEELEADFSRICDDIAVSIEEDQRQEDISWAKFSATLDKVSETVGSRAKAIRYLMDAEGCYHDHMQQYDVGFFCHLNGLSYRKEAELKAIMEG